jgi:hypothetical protein
MTDIDMDAMPPPAHTKTRERNGLSIATARSDFSAYKSNQVFFGGGERRLSHHLIGHG